MLIGGVVVCNVCISWLFLNNTIINNNDIIEKEAKKIKDKIKQNENKLDNLKKKITSEKSVYMQDCSIDQLEILISIKKTEDEIFKLKCWYTVLYPDDKI